MLASIDDVIEIMSIQLSTAVSALSSEGLEAAANSAVAELGWSLPVSEEKKCYWLVKRATRHACYILWTASAQKFKYKQVNLQQRFEHYEKLIKHMDTEFENAFTSDSALFANVEAYKLFGTAVGAGFKYDFMGNDVTYTDLVRFINVGN
jgi:hypothetical protein